MAVLAIRQCAAWASTLKIHNLSRNKKITEVKETYAPTPTPSWTYFRLELLSWSMLSSGYSAAAYLSSMPTIIPWGTIEAERKVDSVMQACATYRLSRVLQHYARISPLLSLSYRSTSHTAEVCDIFSLSCVVIVPYRRCLPHAQGNVGYHLPPSWVIIASYRPCLPHAVCNLR